MPRKRLRELLETDHLELKNGGATYLLELQEKPSCSVNCPAGVNVKSYMNLVSDKRYIEALEVVMEANPFPGICGRVCTHPCEANCENEDGALAIKLVKRFAADYEMARRPLHVEKPVILHPEKIAVVGAGPAGLTAAYDLARMGYETVVFDDFPTPGGLMDKGIPRFRLPKRITDFEIEHIKRLGAKIVSGKAVSSAGELLEEGYTAVILAAGAKKDKELGIPGTDSPRVLSCLGLLEQVACGELAPLEGHVVVIGGGNSAMDAARTAKRLGARVTIAYRRTEEEMPADHLEVEEAREEGVELLTLAIPKAIVPVKDGKSIGVEFIKAKMGDPDDSGRRRPVPIPGSEFLLEADWVIPAVGQIADVGGFSPDMCLNDDGTVKTGLLGETGDSRVFAAGDVVLGPSSVVEAIGSGHDAAMGVHMMLRGMKETDVKKDDGRAMLGFARERKAKSVGSCLLPECSDSSDRVQCFDEVEECPGESAIMDEASRCKRCGACYHCNVCLSSCSQKQVMANLDGNRFFVKVDRDFSLSLLEGSKDWKLVADGVEKDISLSHLTAVVDREKCIACGLCEEACAYRAISVRQRKDDVWSAEVEHDVCRSCGACTAACPTGAVSQGAMSQCSLMDVVGSGLEANDVLTVKCHWNSNSDVFSEDAVEVMCTRMVGAELILSALAKGYRGVSIMSCPSKKGCHYLPAPFPGKKRVDHIQRAIDIAGGNPNRIAFSEAWWYEKTALEEKVSRAVSGGDKSIEPVEGYSTPMGRAMGLLMNMAGMKDLDMMELVSLRLANAVSKSYGLEILDYLESSAIRAFEHMGIAHDSAATRENIMCLANRVLEEKGGANPRIKVAFLKNEGWLGELLSSFKGVDMVELDAQEPMCEWPDMTPTSRDAGLRLLEKAAESGADVFLTGSIRLYAGLRTITREGGWTRAMMHVANPYSFSLCGGDVI